MFSSTAPSFRPSFGRIFFDDDSAAPIYFADHRSWAAVDGDDVASIVFWMRPRTSTSATTVVSPRRDDDFDYSSSLSDEDSLVLPDKSFF